MYSKKVAIVVSTWIFIGFMFNPLKHMYLPTFPICLPCFFIQSDECGIINIQDEGDILQNVQTVNIPLDYIMLEGEKTNPRMIIIWVDANCFWSTFLLGVEKNTNTRLMLYTMYQRLC